MRGAGSSCATCSVSAVWSLPRRYAPVIDGPAPPLGHIDPKLGQHESGVGTEHVRDFSTIVLFRRCTIHPVRGPGYVSGKLASSGAVLA
jgi:hypothetical protein